MNQTIRPSQPIAWSLALVSVFFTWQLHLGASVGTTIQTWGISANSWPYRVICDGLPPVIFVATTAFALFIYRNVFWRFWPWSSCREGWWIYGLVRNNPHDRILVAGLFHMAHGASDANIDEGFAYYVHGDRLQPRGAWTSEVIWISASSMRFLYRMFAQNPCPEAMPSNCRGYLELSKHSWLPLAGGEAWDGTFQDMDERRNINGWVYAERLSRIRVRNRHAAYQLLSLHSDALIKRVDEVRA